MPRMRQKIYGCFWATVDPFGNRPPCIWGKRKSDADEGCDPDEIVVMLLVEEVEK